MSEMAELNFKVEDLSKSYTTGKRSVKALDKVSFTLTPGIYGLLGPNGAGKSTLIHCITGSLLPNGGSMYWCGKNILRTPKSYRRILGYMPQQQNLYDGFTGARFLQYLAALKEIPREQVESEVLRVAGAVRLVEELPKKLSAYSGGMKQRLLAAAALLGDPKLIIMDEPTAGLDPKQRVQLRNTLASLSKDKIILVATHVVSDVESVAKEILLLQSGHLADLAAPETLIEKYAPGGTLEDVYLAIFGEDDGV